jgi:flagellar hook-associated protein FlgK
MSYPGPSKPVRLGGIGPAGRIIPHCTLLDEIVGRVRQFGSHADGLEDENHRLQAELSALFEARRDNEDTFTIRPWDETGTRLVDTIASAQNLHVARAAFRDSSCSPM